MTFWVNKYEIFLEKELCQTHNTKRRRQSQDRYTGLAKACAAALPVWQKGFRNLNGQYYSLRAFLRKDKHRK